MSDQPNCCCRFGCAVSGEWPEFPCQDCPIHDEEWMKDGSRCRRHAALFARTFGLKSPSRS